MTTEDEPRSVVRHLVRVAKPALSIALVAGIFLGVLPAIADYSDVWVTIRAMTLSEVGSLVGVGLWNLSTYWLLMIAVLPGLTIAQAAVVNQASTAVANTLPGGGALGVGVSYAMYTSWGFGIEPIGLATVISGVWNTFIKLGLPLLAVAALAFTDPAGSGLVFASLLGLGALVAAVVVFWLAFRSEKAARRVGAAVGRLVSSVRSFFRRGSVAGWDEAAAGFRRRTNALVGDRWVAITVTALVSHLSLFVMLLVSLRHVGVSEADVDWIHVLAAFAFVRLISALPITPGGVGVVELGYAAALTVGMEDPMKAQVVAAVLVFRFITFFLPVPFGAGAYLFWRRNSSWRKTSA